MLYCERMHCTTPMIEAVVVAPQVKLSLMMPASHIGASVQVLAVPLLTQVLVF